MLDMTSGSGKRYYWDLTTKYAVSRALGGRTVRRTGAISCRAFDRRGGSAWNGGNHRHRL